MVLICFVLFVCCLHIADVTHLVFLPEVVIGRALKQINNGERDEEFEG